MCSSRSEAGAAIRAGRVLVAGAPADKAARLVAAGEPLSLVDTGPRYVGRGGEKLAAALDELSIDVAHCRALDAGSSTGGFTDCLLQRGAATVVAVDVGRGQLAAELRTHARVVLHEQTDIRTYAAEHAGSAGFDLVVGDLSFISLKTVAPSLVSLTRPGGDLVVLIKPQFEVGRREVSRGRGIISDPDLWAEAIGAVIASFARAGASAAGLVPSIIRGAKGNVEFVAHLVRTPTARPSTAAAAVDVTGAVARASSAATTAGSDTCPS